MDVIEQLRGDVQVSRRKREEHIPNWQLNVNERRGKDFDTASDETRSRVPMDWTLTKTKAAQLFSQMPQVRLVPKHAMFGAAVPVAAKIQNDLLKVAGVESVMGEVVVDCVNAAGIGAAIVRYESLSDTTNVSAVDPVAIQMAAMATPDAPAPVADPAQPVQKAPMARITDRRFCVDRVSPSDLLWPVHFRLSDWNKCPWLGHTDRGQWAMVKKLFPPDPEKNRRGLTDEDKEKVIGAAFKRRDQDISSLTETDRKSQGELVEYDEIFYWRYLYHEDEKYYDAIHRVVFVAGIDEPVVNEPWTGQKFDQGTYLGSCLLPIRILTLNYITDEAIPPSDSAVIRPQVKELQQSREDMKDQRKHSKPLRWFDVDRVDPNISGDLVKGTWQGMIPTIGAGDKAIGEVSRTAYPRENLEFDRMLKQDIQEAVSIGPNQQGTFASGERSAREAGIVDRAFQTEIGLQRARVATFFIGIAEVLFGLWALYGEVEPLGIGASIGEDGLQKLQTWDRQSINQKFIAEVRADLMVRVEAKDVVEQITSVLNVTAQSGFINPKPLITRILDASGIDPSEVIVEPKPKGPEPPKISYTFKGEDLLNPFVIAIILKTGQGPTQEELEAGKRAAAEMQMPVKSPTPTASPDGHPLPQPDAPVTNPEIPDKKFPQWESAPRINTRRAEG